MAFCTVTDAKKTYQSPLEALLCRARANQVSVGSLYFNIDELFQLLVFLQADASCLETEELAYSSLVLCIDGTARSALAGF